MKIRRVLPIGILLLCLAFSACRSASQTSIQDNAPNIDAVSMLSLPTAPSSASSAAPLAAKAIALISPKAFAANGSGFIHRKPFRVPILMYHYIRPMPDPKKDKLGGGLTVTPATFVKQLDILQQKGYHTISFAMLADTGAVLPKNPVILTFDDGYQDAYDQAFPALLAHHMTATFYIISGFIGKPNYATWDELREMSGSGMEIGAHTVSHLDLNHLSFAQQARQILDSITTIEQTLGVHILSLAYPAGRYNADTLKIMRTSGMKFAVTTHLGVATQLFDPMQLPRVRIFEKTDFAKLF